MRTGRKRLGFWWLLLRNFFGFLLVLGTVSVVAVIGIAILLFTALFSTNYGVLETYRNDMVSMSYENISGKFQGQDSDYLIVFDLNGNTVYTSNDSKEFNFSNIELVPKSSTDIEIISETYVGADEKTYHSIWYKNFTETTDSTYGQIVTDENYNVIFSNIENGKTSYTKEEFELLAGKYDSEFLVSKMEFTSDSGDAYIAVLVLNEEGIVNPFLNAGKIASYVGYAYLFVAVIIILLFLIRLDRKVKTPITLLQKAITGFAEKEEYKPITYKGPREFMEICDSFNLLATKLQTSEIERVKVEEQKKQMLADISHDLKTPITVIMGYAEAISNNVVPEDKKAEGLRLIVNESEYLSNLISELSEYNKLERADFKLKLTEIDICEYSREYLIDMVDSLETAGLDLDTNIPDEPIYLQIDAFQMRRVFDNIISNSIKYHQTGDTLYFEIAKQGDKTKITICDNGVGIGEDLRETIFTPFVMADKARTEGQGTGLGMAIVEKIVTAHGGEIKLLPPNERFKTVFEITVPNNTNK